MRWTSRLRSLALVLVGSAFGLGALASAASAQSASTIAPKTGWGYLTMKDGVRLRYAYTLPEGRGPFPVALNYSGYNPGTDPSTSTPTEAALREHGYATIGVNARGSGCSTGTYGDLLGPSWASDARQVIDWIARQDWSDGNVGMVGVSFPGVTQWTAARDPSPALKAIVPASTMTDPYRDDAFPGGIMNTEFFALWAGIQNGEAALSIPEAAQAGDAECAANYAGHTPSNLGDQVIFLQRANPFFNDFWKSRAASENLHDLKIPTLAINAWQDDATGSRVMSTYQDYVDPENLWVIAGNGGHDWTGTCDGCLDQTLKFLDRYLKGAENGWERTPHTQLELDSTAPAVLLPGTPRARLTAPQWPPPTRTARLFLRDGGALRRARPAKAERAASYDYPLPSPSVHGIYASGVERLSWKQPQSTLGAVAWTTPPLSRQAVLFGPQSADLWMSSTAPDTDVQVTLTEVRPDGQEVYLQRGWLRASMRALDEQRSTARQPFHPFTKAASAPLTPGKPELLRVEFRPVAHVVRAGSSLRLIVDAPTGSTGTMGFDYLTGKATNTILDDAEHPSSLALGFLPGRSVDSPLPACDTSLNQPCRPDLLGRPSGSLALDDGAEPATTVELPASSGAECRSRRVLRVRVRARGGDRLQRIDVLVGGSRRASLTGRRLRRRGRAVTIDLRGLPRGTYAVEVRTRLLRRGRSLTTTDRRTYRTCRRGR